MTKTLKTISVVMGSKSDFPTMKHCVDILKQFEIDYSVEIVSAHRTPQKLFEFAQTAKERGAKIIIAAAGGAAHLAGMVASLSELPVLGVPIESKVLSGWDSLLSTVQMPGGVPVATFAIGESGAKNAALFAISILALNDQKIDEKLKLFRKNQTQKILDNPDPTK